MAANVAITFITSAYSVMPERHSEYERADSDWYVEPGWVVERLLGLVEVPDGFHDPCAGQGTIVKVGRTRGIAATGADIVDRASGQFPAQDYLADQRRHPAIITNPPFRLAADIIQHALDTTIESGIVAAFVPIKFLASQRRHALFTRREFARVIVLSRRPSVPPGTALMALGEGIRGNGSIDFAWCVWIAGKAVPGASVEWSM